MTLPDFVALQALALLLWWALNPLIAPALVAVESYVASYLNRYLDDD